MAGAASDSSAVVRGWETLVERLRTAAATARVRTVATTANRRVSRGVAQAFRQSGLSALAARLRAFILASYCYRWLTAEPDPEVIVIDLRETYTVGWLIALLDWLGRRFGPPIRAAANDSLVAEYRDQVEARPLRPLGVVVLFATMTNLGMELLSGSVSGLGLAIHAALALLAVAGLRSTASWEELRKSRLGTWLVAVFEPPDPVESRADDGAGGPGERGAARTDGTDTDREG